MARPVLKLVAPPSNEGVPPPHDLDAEAAVLSAVLLDPAALPSIADIVDRDSFYSEAHSRIFEACDELARTGAPISVVAVGTVLKNRERIAQVGGMAYLTDVLNSPGEIRDVRHYANTVREKARLRDLIATCQRIAAEGYHDVGEAQAFIDGAERAISAISLGAVEKALERNVDMLRRIVSNAREAQRVGRYITGIASGIEKLDRFTNGMHPKQMTIIGGRPGQGKSALGAQIAREVAVEQDIGVLFFSLEMPREDIITRLVCGFSNVDAQKFARGQIGDDDFDRLMVEGSRVAMAPLWVDDNEGRGFTMSEIRGRAIRRLAASAKDKPLGLIVVDYLQKVRHSGLDKNGKRIERREQIAEISEGLRMLAHEIKVPVVALAQLNRGAGAKGGKSVRPTMADIRECGDIEQDALVILLIHREEKDSKEVELLLEKSRNGRVAVIKMDWEASMTRFKNQRREDFE